MYCGDNEDEHHFIYICQLYEQLRRRCIPEYHYEKPNMHTFIELMSNDDTKTVCSRQILYLKHF